MTKYKERQLVIPALQIIRNNPKGIDTTNLIKELIKELKPDGEDMKPSRGRSDPHFTQTVRNLKSHDTLLREKLVMYSGSDRNRIWKITRKGLERIERVEMAEDDTPLEDIAASLNKQGFSRKTIKKEADNKFKGMIIEEGSLDKRTITQRNRSNKLREIAISEFKKQHGGELYCVVCGFNFHKEYGELGKDFIEIHHLEPMHLMDIEGDKVTLNEALKRVATVCPNCHRMIHRVKEKMLSVGEVKSLLGKTR